MILDDVSLAILHAPPSELNDSSELTRGSPMWIAIGNICSLIKIFDWDPCPPSLLMSNFNSLNSTAALGVCNDFGRTKKEVVSVN